MNTFSPAISNQIDSCLRLAIYAITDNNADADADADKN
ncbi:MAG: hypothetical protein ACJASL_003074, partial [Paraglaciecola sp.]